MVNHHQPGVIRDAATVLVVDDETQLTALIDSYLTHEGFRVLTAADGPAAVAAARAESPAVIVLDLMLPGFDGLEVCRQIRRFSDAYVIMLSARAEEVDKLMGLAAGADDYLTKPFSPRELVARIRAMLRRPRLADAAPAEATPPQRLGDLSIDRERHEVTRDGRPAPLTSREFALLALLAESPGRVFTRSQLLERLWGSDYFDDHVVEVHIRNLRQKVEEDPARPRLIQTVRGVGYRLAQPEGERP